MTSSQSSLTETRTEHAPARVLDQMNSVLPESDWRKIIDGQKIWFRVAGDSMYPTLKADDSVLVEPFQAEPIAGTVVVFQQDNYLVVHRYKSGGVIQGDNRLDPDPAVNLENIIGTVRMFRRNGCVYHLSTFMPWQTRGRRILLRMKRCYKKGIRCFLRRLAA